MTSPADLKQYVVPPHELQVGEFCFKIETEFTDKPRKDPKVEHSKAIVCGLLNTCGGVISHHTTTSVDSKTLDDWTLGYIQQLESSFGSHIAGRCIQIVDEEHKGDPGHTSHVLVKRSPKITTVDFGLYTRNGAKSSKIKDVDTACSILTRQTSPRVPSHLPTPLKVGCFVNCPESDGHEFKAWKASNVSDIIKKLKDKRNEKTLFALPNLESGGHMYIGVHDSGKVLGQILEEADEEKLTEGIEQLLIKDAESGQPRIWGEPGAKPVRGKQWDIQFIPVSDATPRRVIICIQFNHVPGGVFQYHPQSFIVDDDGNVPLMDLTTWRKRVMELKPDVTKMMETPKFGVETKGTASIPRPSQSRHEGLRTDEDNEIDDKALAEANFLSYTKHTTNWRRHLEKAKRTSDILPMMKEILKFDHPLTTVPDVTTVKASCSNDDLVDQCMETIRQHHDTNRGTAIVAKPWAKHLDKRLRQPPDLLFDVISLDIRNQICLSTVTESKDEAPGVYNKEAGRILKKRLVDEIQKAKLSTEIEGLAVVVSCRTITPENTSQSCWLEDACFGFFRPPVESDIMRCAFGALLLNGNTSLRTKFGDEMSIQLTMDQMRQLIGSDIHRFNYFQGPPGSGKTIMLLYLCREFGPDNCFVLCSNDSLRSYMKYQGAQNTVLIQGNDDMVKFLDTDFKDKHHILIDDCHTINCLKQTWTQLFEKVSRTEGCQMFIFADTDIQSYEQNESKQIMRQRFFSITKDLKTTPHTKALQEVHRNTETITAFIAGMFQDRTIKSANDDPGDDVQTTKIPSLFENNYENGLLELVRSLANPIKLLEGNPECYELRDIAILVDGEQSSEDVKLFTELFTEYFSESKPQKSDKFPVKGLVIDCVSAFSGLDAKVVIHISRRAQDDESPCSLNNKHYRAFVTSRATHRVVFATENNMDRQTAKNMMTDNLLKLADSPKQPRTEEGDRQSDSGDTDDSSKRELNPTDDPSPEPAKRAKGLPVAVLKSAIRGVHVYERHPAQGTQLELSSNATSEYPFAVKLCDPQGEMVGHVAAEHAELVTGLIGQITMIAFVRDERVVWSVKAGGLEIGIDIRFYSEDQVTISRLNEQFARMHYVPQYSP